MRSVYLIRHGHPDFPYGAHMCLGRTDTPLGALGRMQACLLGEELHEKRLTVFASPLTRCRETAAPLGGDAILVPDLAEQDMGPWDGLDFDTIKERWPELYARRGAEPLLVPPGAETLAEVQARVLPAFRRCITESCGDIAVVVHASVIQAILASLRDIALEDSRPLRPPYASYARIRFYGDLHVDCEAVLPKLPLTPELAEKLLCAAAPGAKAEAHCRAVADEALRIAGELPVALDLPLLQSAALLHDVARSAPRHAAVAAQWLRALGFPEAASLVAQHHDWNGDTPDEAALLYLADKCVRESEVVSLEERFAASRSKCTGAEALAAHERRYQSAAGLRDLVNRLSGKQLVE